MAKQTRNTLKGFFETGKKPTGGNYADLLDSFLLVNSENTGSIDIEGSITASGGLNISGDITASGNISASGTIFADTFQSHGSTEIGVSDSLNVTGGITASNISSSGFVSASAFSGDGSGLTNITASSLSIQQITASYLSGSIQVTGSLTYTSGSTNVLYGIQSSGSIIPDSSSAWDLGGPNHYWRDLFLSEGSLRFVSESGDISDFRQSDVDNLKAGKTSQTAKSFSSVGEEASVDGLKNYLRPEAIYHPTDDETAILLNTIGKLAYRSPGGDPFTIASDGASAGYIRLGSTTTRNDTIGGNHSLGMAIQIPGHISASNQRATHHVAGTVKIWSGSNAAIWLYATGSHAGNVSASGKISASGGFETDNSASFGHISASGDLKVDGFASFGGFGNVQSMTSNTTVPTNTNMILYGPITVGNSATLNIAVGSQVLVKDLLNA